AVPVSRMVVRFGALYAPNRTHVSAPTGRLSDWVLLMHRIGQPLSHVRRLSDRCHGQGAEPPAAGRRTAPRIAHASNQAAMRVRSAPPNRTRTHGRGDARAIQHP